MISTPVFKHVTGVETSITYEREDGRTVQMSVLHPNFLFSPPKLVIVIGNEEEQETENFHCYLSFSERLMQEICKYLNESPEILTLLPVLSTDEMLVLRDLLNHPLVKDLSGVSCETAA